MINLLVVDDSALMRKLLGKIFAAEADFTLRYARNGVEALEEIRREKPDVVTLDIHMPDMDGLTCLDKIMVEHPCPVVMFSALTAEGAAITLDALQRGAVDFVAKPSGAVSLEIDALSAQLIAKVRAASTARLRGSLRLKERVRHRIGGDFPTSWPKRSIPRSTGEGIVLVGTSTGGPPALEALLVPLAADFPWPIVVVQHMPESFTGPLARRLDGLCALSVTEVQRRVAFAARLRLYRARRCRYPDLIAQRRVVCRERCRRPRLSLASEYRPPGPQRHARSRGLPVDRHPDDRHGR